jgi:hypothetical protein
MINYCSQTIGNTFFDPCSYNISLSSRRGFDDKLKILMNHGDFPEDDVLDDLAGEINRGIQRSILNDTLANTADNRMFSIKIEAIFPEAEAKSRELLAFMFGAKYCQFTTSFGLKLNGRPRGAKTLIEINKVTHREFAFLDLKSAWSELQSRQLPRIEKLVDGLDDMAINENKWRNVNPKKLKTLIGSKDAGDVIVFDPMLTSGSRRQCRFDIGQVVRISYPYDIEVSTWRSLTSTEYVLKKMVQNIHRDTVRYKFDDNPIMQNKIVLTDEIFTTITKNFYNGK